MRNVNIPVRSYGHGSPNKNRWFRRSCLGGFEKKQGIANGAMCTWHAVLLFFLLALVLSRNVEWMVQSGEQRAPQEFETKQRRSSWLIFSKLSMTRKRMHMLLLAQQHPANILCRFFLLKDRWLEYNLRVVSCLSIIPKLLSLIHIVALQRSKLSSRNLNAVRVHSITSRCGALCLAKIEWQLVMLFFDCTWEKIYSSQAPWVSTADCSLHFKLVTWRRTHSSWAALDKWFPSQRRTSRCLGAVLHNQICVTQVNHLICKKALATADDRVFPHRT